MKQQLKRIIQYTLLLISYVSIAQVELKNKVVDYTTFLPIENASVYVKGTTIGTVTNSDGKFVLVVPNKHQKDTLIISSIGYKSFKTQIDEFDDSFEVILEEDVASLDEVLLVAETRPQTGNEVVLRALERLERNMPDSSYIQRGFIRHKERNKREFKWLIESAITLYDSGYQSNPSENLKVNVDEVRKSYDLRDVDSLLQYVAYLKNNVKGLNIQPKNLIRDTIETKSLVKAIKWNDNKVNGLENLFLGKLNLLRNVTDKDALFGENLLRNHQFKIDTILVDNERKIYKIEISESTDFVNLKTKGIYNDGYEAKGWLYIYWDSYAIKKIEYELVAASPAQKSRSKALFDTNVNHKLEISYREYLDKMYLNYIYYETPKLVNVGDRNNQEETKEERDKRFYYTVQEVLFTEVILDKDQVDTELKSKTWNPDLFSPRPYNKSFWKNYNTLLESEEEEKLINDLTKRYSLFKD
jgi:hypothetical protein